MLLDLARRLCAAFYGLPKVTEKQWDELGSTSRERWLRVARAFADYREPTPKLERDDWM